MQQYEAFLNFVRKRHRGVKSSEDRGVSLGAGPAKASSNPQVGSCIILSWEVQGTDKEGTV